MQTSKFLYWGAQLGGWLVYAMLAILATYADNPAKINFKFWISLFCLVTAGIVVTHLMRLFLLKRNWMKLKFGPLIPRILLISVASATLFVLIIHLANYWIEGKISLNNFLGMLLVVMSTTLLMILWNAIYFTYHFFRKSIHQELHNLQLVSSQNEIELKTLRSQLNPHFLFNALNSIRALIDIEPTKAKQSVTTLSNLLRSSLVLGKNEYISVKEELQIVQSYLELEKIRFEERLEIAWELDETCMHYLVPPFILQTQAENAIKHGISKLIEGGEIRIQTRLIDSMWLELNVINTGILGQSVDTGIGIENSKRRLDLQYGLNAFFELKQANNEVVCTIKIKL